MKQVYFTLSLLLMGFQTDGQICPKDDQIISYIHKNLKSDLNSFLEIKLCDLKNPVLFCFDEKLKSKVSEVEETTPFYLSCDVDSLVNSHYVLFYSDIIREKVLVEVFFYRESYFNIPGKTKHETWKRQNGGIFYLFAFNKKGCIENVEKRGLSYD